MIFRKFAFFLLFYFPFSAFSQLQTTSDTSRMDTIFFLNGEAKAVKIVDTTYHLIRFLPGYQKKKPKVMDVEKDRVFSVKFSNGQERIIYFYDSTVGNVFSVLEAKMFMLGEREAERSYRNKWPFLIGFAAGTLSPVLVPNAVVLSPILPAITPLYTRFPVIRVDTAKIPNKNYLQYDTYLMGYEKIARRKNFMHSIFGAGIGLAVGLGTWAIPDKTWSSVGLDASAAKADKTWRGFVKQNFLYAVWIGEVGCSIGISCWHYKRKTKK